jgi:signal transduction histidine kinase
MVGREPLCDSARMARLKRRERVALAELLCDVVERRDDEIAVRLEVLARPRVEARATALALAVDNLIDNAVRASPPGGLVQVRLATAGDRAVIEIVDQGRGLSPDVDLFEPLHCGDGLGLAATQAIALAYGGKLELKLPPTTFRLTLPAA